MKKIICTLTAAITLLSCAAAVSADTLKTENGLKYRVSDSGESSLFTGWTTSGGEVKYYSKGKRRTGWQNINGGKYYLLPTGGYADGVFQIDGKVWEFSHGKLQYGPYDIDEYNNYEPAKEGEPTRLQFEAQFTLTSQIRKDDRYLNDYCGMYWDSEKQTYVILLTNLSRKDFYKGLGGEAIDYEIKTAKFSRNYLDKLDWLCIKKYAPVVCSCMISDEDNNVDIRVTDKSKIKEIYTYITENGFDPMAFSIEYEPNPEKYYDE